MNSLNINQGDYFVVGVMSNFLAFTFSPNSRQHWGFRPAFALHSNKIFYQNSARHQLVERVVVKQGDVSSKAF